MLSLSCHDNDWLDRSLAAFAEDGCFVVTDVLDDGFIEETRAAMYRTQQAIRDDVGQDRLERAGELGVLRLMVRYDDFFLRYLELPEALAVVDATVSPTAILHLQNGLVLPSFPEGKVPETFQTTFHMDFPRYLQGYLASINLFYAIDEFREDNGATIVAPGTHQRPERPSDEELEAKRVAVVCPAGSMLVFDSTLWHAAGANASGRDRLAINHQFTRSWIKQQMDYPRALGAERIEAQPDRTQQLLGWYTRTPASLDDFYQPTERRLYRSGQG